MLPLFFCFLLLRVNRARVLQSAPKRRKFPGKIALKKHHGEGVPESPVRGGIFYNPLTQRLLVACYYFDPATVSWVLL